MRIEPPKGHLKETYPEWHELLYWLVHHPDNHLTAQGLADGLRVGLSTIHHYCLGSRKFPLMEQLVPLLIVTGRPEPLQWFAEQAGYLLVPQPRHFERLTLDMMRELIHSQRTHVAACEAALHALEDGRIECEEARAVQSKIQNALVALATLAAALEQSTEG